MPGAGMVLAVRADAVFQGLSFGEVADVVQRDLGNVVHGLLREKRLMGGDKDIGECHEPRQYIVGDRLVRAVLEEVVGLLLVNVEPRAADLSRLERVDQRLRVDQFSPAGVENDDAAFHHGDAFRIDQVAVFRRQRAMQGDDVAFPVKLLQLLPGKVQVHPHQQNTGPGHQLMVQLQVLGQALQRRHTIQHRLKFQPFEQGPHGIPLSILHGNRNLGRQTGQIALNALLEMCTFHLQLLPHQRVYQCLKAMVQLPVLKTA